MNVRAFADVAIGSGPGVDALAAPAARSLCAGGDNRRACDVR